MIKYVLIDLDDTIFDFHMSEAESIRKTLSELGIGPTDEVVARYSEINAGLWELLEEKKITRNEVLVNRFEILFRELGVSIPGIKGKELYETHLCKGNHFVFGAEKMLTELYGKYELYIVSNGTVNVQDSRIAISGISKYFRKIFISQRVGFDKPDAKFFEKCFSEIPGFEKDKCIIVGDSQTSDIRGGNNAGIKTCWFNSKGKPKNDNVHIDYEIKVLSELPELLAKL